MHVRQADKQDNEAIKRLLRQMHSQAAVNLPEIEELLLDSTVNEVLTGGYCFVSFQEDILTGTIGGVLAETYWWSSERTLSDYWFYVLPEFRQSTAAAKLIRKFLYIGDTLNVNVLIGHMYGKDVKRKDAFYERQGLEHTGSIFLKEKE